MASATSEYDVLQSSFLGVVQAIHATALERQRAIAAKDQTRVTTLTDQINRNIDVANGYIARLREIEGPGSVYRFIDKLGDVVVQTAQAIAYGIEATAKFVGRVVTDVAEPPAKAAAKLLLPFVIVGGLLLVAAIYYAGKGGALRLKSLA